jgi:hypothetical protein
MSSLQLPQAPSRTSVESAIRNSWDQSTTVDPQDWSPQNAALGQCAVTAVIIQDFFGGEIWRGKVGTVSHYFNVLEDGAVIDLTWEQFPTDAVMEDPSPRSRAYVLSFDETRRRYERLTEKVDSELHIRS